MRVLLAVSLAAALASPQTLELVVERQPGALQASFRLPEGLPDSLEEALPSGAEVRVTYEMRVKVHRRYIWNRRLWSGLCVSTVAFDPVIGRYRCELVLDDVIVSSREVDTAAQARQWLVAPPPVRLVLPPSRRPLQLRIKARAIFASSTTWLIFPSVEGTDWVEVRVGDES